MEFASAYHAPVLVGEVVDLLRGRRTVLDCTLGGGGHSSALLAADVENIIGVDRDPDALAAAGERLRAFSDAGRFQAVQSNYASIDAVSALDGLAFDGILIDLGISSHQIDDTERGFSFRAGARLDMRMGEDVPANAADLLNDEDETTLTSIFRDYGDEPKAGRLAREIVRRRGNKPFATSDDLVGAIRAVLGARSGSGRLRPSLSGHSYRRERRAPRSRACAADVARPPHAGGAARHHRLPLGRGPPRQTRFSRVEHGLYLSAQTAVLHLSRRRPRRDADASRRDRVRGRDES